MSVRDDLLQVIHHAATGHPRERFNVGRITDAVLRALIEWSGGPYHVAAIREDRSFTLQHPIMERLNGSLFDCDVHAKIAALNWPAQVPPPGRYQVGANEDGVWWGVRLDADGGDV